MTLFDLGKPDKAPLQEVKSAVFLHKYQIEVTLVCGHKKQHTGSTHPKRFRCEQCRKEARVKK